MTEFVMSALPWVMAGLALAILEANQGLEKNKDENQTERISLGMALGLLFGVALNGCSLWENSVYTVKSDS